MESTDKKRVRRRNAERLSNFETIFGQCLTVLQVFRLGGESNRAGDGAETALYAFE